MAEMSLENARIQAGVWEGLLTVPGGQEPALEVIHQGQALPGIEVTALPDQPGQFGVRVPIPAELLSDGIQTFVVQDKLTGQTLGSFAIVTGEPLQPDLRAEIDLLRSELDMLKRAFRRHCQSGDQE